MLDDDGRWPPQWGISFPKVTISAFTETGQPDSSIIVPFQREYTNALVISSRLADTPCATLGVRGILDRLNFTLGTSYTLDNPSLSSLLEDCITNNDDFGTAYGLLRRIWYTRDWSNIRAKLHKWEEEDREMRQNALNGNRIVNPNLRPRRVWDLYSNRVVPCWCMCTNIHDCRFQWCWPRPISHAWMDEEDRVDVWTPINRYEWPVPILKDAHLNLVHIEMLNLRLEYTWLDVLCLRQKNGPKEDMCVEEWKLDVPTIGAVYRTHNLPMVWYLNGLGRPLSLTEGDLDSNRSWFKRAWTLQETGKIRDIAGDAPDGPLHAKYKDGKYETKLLTRFHEQLMAVSHVCQISKGNMVEALKSMQYRVSTNPIDKVAGLAFILGSETIPVYNEGQPLEDAWAALVNSVGELRGRLFIYPEPGSAGAKWRPSWKQIMTEPLPADDVELYFKFNVYRDEKMKEDSCKVECIKNALVQGLAVVVKGSANRRGKLVVKDNRGRKHRFKIMAKHMYPIPGDTYTLINSWYVFGRIYRSGWVVGRSLPGGKFEKVSVLEIAHKEQRRLEDLDIIETRQYILI